MMLRRMYPTLAFDNLRQDFDRVFEGILGPMSNVGAFSTSVFPAVNVWEDGDRLYAEAELPGVEMKDLEISVVGNELAIKGERKPVQGEKVVYHRQERGTGAFARFVTLPVAVDASAVEAVLKNGVLTITLPKAAEAKPRRIEVRTH